MADTIYTSQTPNGSDFDGAAHAWGMEFTVSADALCIGGRAWVPNPGRPATFFWQLWRISDATLIAEVDLNDPSFGTPTSNAWMSFTSADFLTPGDVALDAADDYIVDVFFDDGDGVFVDDGSETFPVGSGGIVSSSTARFNNGAAQNVMPAGTQISYFFADVEAEEDDPTVTGVLTVEVPAVQFAADGELTASGFLAVEVPAAEFTADGELSVAGVLDASIPDVFSDIVGQVPVTGILDLTLPELELDLDGNSAAGGATVDPCGWNIPEPICCPDWAGFDAAVQSSAQDYAATILWAATGRQFGLCEVAVRPCGMRRCQTGGEFFGYDWSGGTWVPYIFEGQWFNCACPAICCCDPRCQIRLMGPVASIVEVTIGGIAVDPATYRVDDNHWLVRVGGECWPECSDMDSDDGDNVLVVTYLRGSPVPSALLRAASMLACEWGKACVGADCRLSNRVTSLARNGVTINMVDPGDLLDSGLTGLWEVDTVIKAFNPDGLRQRLRVYAPELNVPRTVTSP